MNPAKLHILLALAGGQMHGYKIIQEIASLSGGKYAIGPGTLYDNLQKLLDDGLVLDLGHRADDDDPRRRYYRLSAAGRRDLSSEVARLDSLVIEAKLRLTRRA